MQEGTHDPLREAARAGNLPEGWVQRADGGRVPAQRDRETGWGDDRDPLVVVRINAARVKLADAAAEYRLAVAQMITGDDKVALMMETIKRANALADAWDRYADLTGGGQ